MAEKKTPENKTVAKKMAVTKGFKFDVDSDLIRRLADLIEETGLSEIELGDGDHRLRVARGGGNIIQAESSPVQAAASTPPADGQAPLDDATAAAGAVPSPMVGTIYVAPEAGAAPFVSVGDKVAKDDILFVIEAMKVMNPIRSPRAGTVLEIMVENGGPVEFGETLLVLG
ncbi:MAG: acetyl-CoA carboxylase, biotin carboxyl carrier protein [Proteobacteria bacterium]|nr:acetyl-CoA carboxylase, biotin carboxyl carrier protein [Pseudomonadota bacterium]